MESAELKEKETNHSFMKNIKYIGIILTGLWGVVWFGGDKITSGTLLLVTMIVMILPIKQNKALRWIRIGFICIVFCFVIWNITTTDMPSDFSFTPNPSETEKINNSYTTGIRFFDQVIHIFMGFLKGRVFQSR